MKKKSEALDKLEEFKAKPEKQLGRHIKSLRSDRGGEYMSIEFVSFIKEHGILSQFSAPGTPQQNGVAERRNRTLFDMVRSMKSFHITFILLEICPRDNNLHSEYSAIQVSTKDTHGNVDKLESYFKSYAYMGLSRLCVKVVI